VQEEVIIGGKTYRTKDILQPWLNRKDDAEKAQDEFLPQIRVNRKFAASKQHLDINPRDGRVVDVRYRNIGGVNVKMITSNVLDQYILTAIGRMAANDYLPNFLAATQDENSTQITQQLNDAFRWGWENEWNGERKVLALLRLLAVDGTAAIRVRYDRKYGDIVGDFPLKDGRPISDRTEARAYVSGLAQKGQTADFMQLREGKVCWEVLSFDQFLTPPGYEYPEDFPWIIIKRPVDVAEIKKRYGKLADGIEPERIDAPESLTSGLGFGDSQGVRLNGKAMVYTGYEMPTADSPEGRTIVFTKDNLLDYFPELPINEHPQGPHHGVHFFRWQVIPGRFAGKAFIENGIGAQTVRNKRITQIDTIIDRNMPKVFVEEQSLARPRTGEPMEVIEVHPGAPLPQVSQGVPPGKWMLDDIAMQDANLEKNMGMRSISLGQPPQGVSAYSAMALLSENDSLKLDPIAHDLRMSMVALAWDTMELMRFWPREKQMEIAGPDGALRAFTFSSNQIPNRYLVTIPRQGSLPRSQAAELQKVNDIWNAAASIGQPLPLDWYVSSLNSGKAQKLPANLTNVSKHKAELENIVMYHSKQVVPVSPEDDDAAHVEIHAQYKQQFDAMAMEGDETAHEVSAIIEQHRQMHLQAAQQKNGGQNGAPGGNNLTPGGQGIQPGSMGPTPGTLGAGTSPQGVINASQGGATPAWLYRPPIRSGL
jgi:hypothetical protein